MTNYLKDLLKQAQHILNETYETALEHCFNYYAERELDYGDNLIEAKKYFKESEYYLSIPQFEDNQITAINSIKTCADEELIDSIDTLTIEELRKAKLIYNQILEIVDQID